jgi:hypothetical protein
MAKECVYGFPCVENPHDFEPDLECCTPEEVIFWTEAKARWDAGERNVRGARCTSTYDSDGKLLMHTTRTSWGIGVNTVDWEDEEDFQAPYERGRRMTDEAKNSIPNWFGPSLAAARHQDEINRWPLWQRLMHQWFVARKCPACMYWKGNR